MDNGKTTILGATMGRDEFVPPGKREDPAGPITTEPPTLADLKQYPQQSGGEASTEPADSPSSDTETLTLIATTDLICSICGQVVQVTGPVTEFLSIHGGAPYRCPDCQPAAVDAVAVMITEPAPEPMPDNTALVTPLAIEIGDRVVTIRGKHGYVIDVFTDDEGKEWIGVQLEDTLTQRPRQENCWETRPRNTVSRALIQLYEFGDIKVDDETVEPAAPAPAVQPQIVAVAPAPLDDATAAIIAALRRDNEALRGQADERDSKISELVDRTQRQETRIREMQDIVAGAQAAQTLLDGLNKALDEATWIEYPPGTPTRNRMFSLIHQHRVAIQTRDQALKSAREFRQEIKEMRAAALDVSASELQLA